MTSESKFIIAIVIVTLGLIIGGMFLLNRQGGGQDQVKGVADQNILLSNTNHTLGNPDATIKIVEFADFQCPACKTAYPIVKKVIGENADKVFFVYRNYPLPSHKNGKIASQAAEAAGIQGKFWEMHDLLYEKQSDWSNSDNPKEVFEGYAKDLGLDTQRFKDDMTNAIGTVNQDYADGNKSGVSSTPTFFVNGQIYSGVIPEEKLKDLIASGQ